MVLIENSDYQLIKSSNSLNSDEKKVLRIIFEASRKVLNTIKSEDMHYLEVDFSIEKKTKNNITSTSPVSYLFFYEKEYQHHPLHLICENLTDAFFYNFIAESYKKQSGFSHHQIRMYPENGGGSTTHKVFAQAIKSRITLCIVDSDKLYSSDTPKETAKNVNSIDIQYGKHIAKKIILNDCQELENLIPIETLRLLIAIQNGETAPENIDLGLAFDSPIENTEYLFADLKSGLDHHSNLDLDSSKWVSLKDTKAKKQWTNLIKNKRKVYLAAYKQGTQAQRKIYVALGSDFLEKLVDYIEKNKYPNLRDTITSSILGTRLESYAKLIMEWSLAFPKISKTAL
ncbi:hypothetical protein ACYSN2_10210 [Ignatzschineria sp. LJL83]